MPKKMNIQLSEDEIRTIILKYLYDSWKNPRGMESHKLQISKIYLELKKKGIERKYVVRNLTYLIETKWVIEEIKKVSFFTGKRSIPNEKKTYSISKDGIDLFDGYSKFQKSDKLVGINLKDIKNSIIIFGDNNFVRNEHKDLAVSLDKLGKQIRINSELSNDDKLDYQAEVDTIKSQLAKSSPDKDIIKKSWNILKGVATINGIIDLYTKTKPLIDFLLSKLS